MLSLGISPISQSFSVFFMLFLFLAVKSFRYVCPAHVFPQPKEDFQRSESPFEQRSYHPSSVHWGWTISVLSPSIYFSLGMHLKDRKYTTSVFIQEKEFPKCFINFLWCFLRRCTHKLSKCHPDDEQRMRAGDEEFLILTAAVMMTYINLGITN